MILNFAHWALKLPTPAVQFLFLSPYIPAKSSTFRQLSATFLKWLKKKKMSLTYFAGHLWSKRAPVAPQWWGPHPQSKRWTRQMTVCHHLKNRESAVPAWLQGCVHGWVCIFHVHLWLRHMLASLITKWIQYPALSHTINCKQSSCSRAVAWQRLFASSPLTSSVTGHRSK